MARHGETSTTAAAFAIPTTSDLSSKFAFVTVSHGKVALHGSGCFDAGSEIDFSILKTIFRDLGWLIAPRPAPTPSR